MVAVGWFFEFIVIVKRVMLFNELKFRLRCR